MLNYKYFKALSGLILEYCLLKYSKSVLKQFSKKQEVLVLN